MSRRPHIHQLRSETLGKSIIFHVEASPIDPANLVLHVICDRSYTYKAEVKQSIPATYRHPQFQGTDDELEALLLRALLSNLSDQTDLAIELAVPSHIIPYSVELILRHRCTAAGIARLRLFPANVVAPTLDWAVQAYRERDLYLGKLDGSQKAIDDAQAALSESEKMTKELRTTLSKHAAEQERHLKEIETAKKEVIQAQTAATELQTTAEDLQRKLDEQGRLIETLSARLQNIKQLKVEEKQLLVLKATMSSKELTIRSLREEIKKNGDGLEEVSAESPVSTFHIQGGPGDFQVQPESNSEHHPRKKRKVADASEAINAAHGLSVL